MQKDDFLNQLDELDEEIETDTPPKSSRRSPLDKYKEQAEVKEKPKAKRKPVPFSLDTDLADALNNHCKSNNLNKSRLVEDLIKGFFKENGITY